MTRNNTDDHDQSQEGPEFQIQETPPKRITLGDFHHPVMRWSMYDRTLSEDLHRSMKDAPPGTFETDAFKEASRMILKLQPLNLEVRLTGEREMTQGESPVGPGLYDFQFYRERDERRFHGMVVDENGQLEPHMSTHAIYLAQVQRFGLSQFDQVHIQGIRWNPDKECFHVIMGS